MKRRITLTLSTAALLAAIAASPSVTSAQSTKPAHAKHSTTEAKADKHALPLPIEATFDRQNSPQDKLKIEVTYSSKEGDKFVAYVRILWGDLDNRIKGGGKQYYSNWDGSLNLRTTGATAIVDKKICFDDKPAKNGKDAHPKPGSGRDEMEKSSGTTIAWDAAVVGHLDGLIIKITSDKAVIPATVKAGKFTTDFTINPESMKNP